MKKSIVSPTFIKQQARKIKKEKSISQSKALDEAVMLHGFANYKNYLKVLDLNKDNRILSIDEALDILEPEKLERIKPRLDATIQRMEGNSKTWLQIFDKLDELSDAEIQKFCENDSSLKDYLELYFLREFLEDYIELEDIEPYHIAKSVTLKGAEYKNSGENSLIVEGKYDLVTEFAFPHEGDPNDDYFKDSLIEICFEIMIDKSLEIKVEYSDIYHSW